MSLRARAWATYRTCRGRGASEGGIMAGAFPSDLVCAAPPPCTRAPHAVEWEPPRPACEEARKEACSSSHLIQPSYLRLPAAKTRAWDRTRPCGIARPADSRARVPLRLTLSLTTVPSSKSGLSIHPRAKDQLTLSSLSTIPSGGLWLGG